MNPLLLNAVVAADSAAGYVPPSTDSFAMRMFKEDGKKSMQERESRRHKKNNSLGSSGGQSFFRLGSDRNTRSPRK
jgi:hypothetical protein